MTRTEKDSMGEKEVPEEAYYGVQTKRALENFLVSGSTESPKLIRAYVMLKKACARANVNCDKLDEEKGRYIEKACDEIIQDEYEDQFVVDVYQAGAGTSFNMNVNEVIANVALELMGENKGEYDKIHPNDHVNMSQSTNDTFPTASHIAIIEASETLSSILVSLADAFQSKGEEFIDIGKSGRTHLMDAAPVTLGDEFLAYGSAIERANKRLNRSKQTLLELPIGGTATGSGSTTPNGFRDEVIEELSKILDRDFKPAKNSFELIHSRSLMADYSSSLKDLASELIRIANDLRLLGSGPRTGIAEIEIPEVQPGSSMMPGKVNPSMAECLNMICFQILGRDTSVSMANRAGQLEMNVMVPLMTYNIIDSIELLQNYLPVFEEKCIRDIEANEETCRNNLERTPALATLLSPKIGYLKAAELAREAKERDMSIPELAKEKDVLPEEELKEIFDLEEITKSKYSFGERKTIL
ncbi:MAG: aspartate ammonia-lyase [Candidatus Thermoplasmatota archaeon]|nr:aspartate ammonia-lyase [Candidatus Thermoplasmatota archaeon]